LSWTFPLATKADLMLQELEAIMATRLIEVKSKQTLLRKLHTFT
jgi:hypothetical protein